MNKREEFTDNYRVNFRLLKNTLNLDDMPSIWIEVDGEQYSLDQVIVERFVDDDKDHIHTSITLKGE